MAKEDSAILRAYFFPLQGRWHFQNRIALGEDSFGVVPKDAYLTPVLRYLPGLLNLGVNMDPGPEQSLEAGKRSPAAVVVKVALGLCLLIVNSIGLG